MGGKEGEGREERRESVERRMEGGRARRREERREGWSEGVKEEGDDGHPQFLKRDCANVQCYRSRAAVSVCTRFSFAPCLLS